MSPISRIVAACAVLLLPISLASAQAPPKNSVTLNWLNPSTYAGGQPLTIGQVSVVVDVTASSTSISGAPTTFTTGVMAAGVHTFNIIVCDNQAPVNCSPNSNTATVTIPASTGTLVVPAASNLTATVN
jgi:hypothetical protein